MEQREESDEADGGFGISKKPSSSWNGIDTADGRSMGNGVGELGEAVPEQEELEGAADSVVIFIVQLMRDQLSCAVRQYALDVDVFYGPENNTLAR
mmetsp:Transcript_57486/g.124923  ORF Transcript_57486/g.124923 Transcript_57486/m.124923 type:complete len:96 (+) Transcript_57486:35-322(+)